MKRLIYAIGLCAALLTGRPLRATAQLPTFDASNLMQAILAFMQDGDNMALNTEQFLQNLGVAKEQLEFLQEMDRRYKEVRADIYKAQEVVRIARNYEMMASMFTRYVNQIKDINGEQITYSQGRALVNEGFQFLLYASREVKRAREFLSNRVQVSEEERMKGLADCDRRISRANAALYEHIKDSYSGIDAGQLLAASAGSLDAAFKIKY